MQRSTILASLALATTLAVAGCGTGGQATPDSATPAASSPATTNPAPASTAVPGEPISAEHNDADMMFAQMMIPHHQQAVQMSDIMLAKDNLNPQIQQLAEKIKAAQGPEIERMNAMLDTWREESAGPMDHGSMGPGSGMDGMLSQQDLDRLTAAQGDEAARLFLTGMIAHHKGAVAMAQQEVTNGRNPQALALARQVINDQQTEITEMEQMLQQLPN
ncbi:DUF305 domain-containing protein [Ammonicoccus fulvus]|uniref:DUF305 domain-containing protein n=1 Tax=Ammonicoccus fulvus TaxID=3138240 RepID=A0ABZ3FNZ7_9ACTN